MTLLGTAQTRLIVLRGNSGSGKSTVARALRGRYGRGLALVEQHYLRRTLLREHDTPGAANIGLIDLTVRYALNHGFDVVLEGILVAGHYGEMLRGLARDHAGQSAFFYFDLPFEETALRHATRPQAGEFTTEAMRAWYRPLDLLGEPSERVLDGSLTVEAAVETIFEAAALTLKRPVPAS